MEIKLNIEDYLTKEEIKEILKQELRYAIQNNRERILSNVAYTMGVKFISELLDENDIEFVRKKVKDILRDDSAIRFEVFRNASIFDKKSKALDIIESEVANCEKLLREKVRKAINFVDEEKIAEKIEEEPFKVFEIIKSYFINS